MSLRTSALLLVCAATATLVLGSTEAATAATPGSLDSSFGGRGIAATGSDSRLFGTVVQGNGDVVAVGETGAAHGNATLLLARFTPSGALDRSFGFGGVATGPLILGSPETNSLGRAVAIQPDGKLVVVGSATDTSGTYAHGLIVERYNANGRLETSFGSLGVVEVFGDPSFGDGYAVAIQPDGKIIAAGNAEAAGSGGTTPRVAVARLNADGSLDTSFGADGTDVLDLGAYSYALAVGLQPDRKIVIVGSAAPGVQGRKRARRSADGLGRARPELRLRRRLLPAPVCHSASNSAFNAVAIQGDGRIVAAGLPRLTIRGPTRCSCALPPRGLRTAHSAPAGVLYALCRQLVIRSNAGGAGRGRRRADAKRRHRRRRNVCQRRDNVRDAVGCDGRRLARREVRPQRRGGADK